MAETYCGKSCAECYEKLQQKCPGCRVGPGKRYGTECDIAKCCILRGEESCEQCTSRNSCFTLRHKGPVSKIQVSHTEESDTDLHNKYEKCALLGKWLMILFWFSIGTIVVNLLFNFRLAGDSFGVITSAIVGIVDSVILLMLTRACGRFRIAGIMGILGTVMNMAELFVKNQTLLVIISLIALVVSMIAEYQQFMGLMDTTAILDSDLAEKWGNLWMAYFVCLCVTGLGLLLTMIGTLLAFLAALAALVGSIGTLVAGVFRIIYLYRTGTMFRGYANNVQELV